MKEEKFESVRLILGNEFTRFEYNFNKNEKTYSINILSSLSTTQFERLMQEGVRFFYDGSNLVLI